MDTALIIKNGRIFSGLVLFLYVLGHLINHSFGIVSIELLDKSRIIFNYIWRNPIGTILLYSSFLIHILINLISIFQMKTLKLPFRKWVQILLGIIIPWFLIIHIVFTGYAHHFEGIEDTYSSVIVGSWVAPPDIWGIKGGYYYIAMLLVVWVHGIIGIHYLCSHRSWYQRNRASINSFFMIIPTLSLLGFFLAGKEALTISNFNKDYLVQELTKSGYLVKSLDQSEMWQPAINLQIFADKLELNYLIALVIILLIVSANMYFVRINKKIKIFFPGGRTIPVSRGYSVLDASREGNIPHASSCGGKGRCTTCRVKILSELTNIPKPNEVEKQVIDRLGFESNIRLACQLRPLSDIKVLPLVPSKIMENKSSYIMRSFGFENNLQGKETEIVIMFIDLRGFTKLSEQKLPYDVIHILNEYFRISGEAIEKNYGRVDKYIGDGVMAIFDSNNDNKLNCKNALIAAKQISKDMKKFNELSKDEFVEELKFGLGIHIGNSIVGLIGHGQSISETAVGDTVNTASRLEQLTKELKCELIISERVANLASLDKTQFNIDKVEIRGKKQKLDILTLSRGFQLAI